MAKKKLKREAITLIEIMIVILLIGLIGGVLTYNFRGSLDEGKAFKSEQGAEQIRNILLWDVAQGNHTLEEAVRDWPEIVKKSAFVAKPEQLIKDGWGQEYKVSVSSDGEDLFVISDKVIAYRNKKNQS